MKSTITNRILFVLGMAFLPLAIFAQDKYAEDDKPKKIKKSNNAFYYQGGLGLSEATYSRSYFDVSGIVYSVETPTVQSIALHNNFIFRKFGIHTAFHRRIDSEYADLKAINRIDFGPMMKFGFFDISVGRSIANYILVETEYSYLERRTTTVEKFNSTYAAMGFSMGRFRISFDYTITEIIDDVVNSIHLAIGVNL